MEENTLTLGDTNSVAPFEASHRQTANSLHRRTRGGGNTYHTRRALGAALASQETQHGQNIGAQYGLLTDAVKDNREDFELNQITEAASSRTRRPSSRGTRGDTVSRRAPRS